MFVQPNDDELKNRLEELFSTGVSQPFSPEKHVFQADTQEVKPHKSSHIESQLLMDEMHQHSIELTVLNEMAAALSSKKTTMEVVEILFAYTTRLMNTTDFFLATYHEEDDLIQFPLVQFDNHRVSIADIPAGSGLTGYIIRTKQPLLLSENIQETMESLGIQSIKIQDDKPALSWLGVPMIFGNRVIGVLSVQSTITPGLFKDHERDLLVAVAGQGAIAIENAHSYEELSLMLSQSEALYSGSQRIVQAMTAQDALVAILDSTRLGSFDRANVLLFDRIWDETEPEFMRVEALWERDGKTSEEAIGTVYRFSQIPLTVIAKKDVPTIILNIDSDRRVHENIRTQMISMGMTGIALFPLVTGDQWIGAITAQARKINRITERDVRQINSLVSQAATIIQDQRLRRDLKDQLREMAAIQQSRSREAWTGYLASKERGNVGYLFDHIDVNPIHSTPFPILDSAKNGVEAENQSIITAPLRVGGVSIGALGIQSETGGIIDEADQELIQSIASQVSQALERARLIEQIQKSAVELQAVASVSSASSTILDPNTLLDQVVNLTKDSFNLYHAHIYLLDDQNTKLTLAAGAGEIGKSMVQEGWTILLDEITIVTRAVHSHSGQVVNDVTQDASFLPNPLLPETTSELAVPIIVGQKVIGVFDVQSNRKNNFSEEDLRTYTTLATQTGIALENAQMFEEQSITVDRLRELDHLKSSFLANMSHELRTPLNSILGFTQVILEGIDGPLTDYMIADLQLIDKNGRHLLNLINEVLDMAKIESGRMSLTFEPVDIRHLLEDVLETTSPQVKEKMIYIHLEIDPQDDLIITGDSIRLRQVLLNLMSNAIKFTETGGVTVHVEKNFNNVHLTFIDTGIGIPKDKLEMIFEAFSQVDSSTTRKVGGTGLGLPISRRLVEMHGGRLWAESNGHLGEGSIFHLVLPVQVSPTK